MRRWMAGAACAMTLSGVALPATAHGQIWKRIKEAADQANKAAGGRTAACPTNATPQCARSAQLGSPIEGALGGESHEQHFRFAVDKPGVLQITLDPMPNQSAVQLEVADAQHQTLGQFVYLRGQPGTRLFQLGAPGTYDVKMISHGDIAERYTLAVANSTPASAGPAPALAAGCARNNTFQCAEPAVVGERAAGAIGGNAPEVYYRFTVDAAQVVQLSLDPMPNRGPVSMNVTDAQYRSLGRFTYEAGQPGARVLRVSAPGTYYVKLSALSDEAERFTLGLRKQP